MAEEHTYFEDDLDINLPFAITDTPRDIDKIEIKHSDYTGLLFPSGRIWNNMKNQIITDNANNFKSITPSAGVYLSAVIEFMTSELLQMSGNVAKRKNKIRIEPPDIKTAIKNDPEFGIFFDTKESKSRLSVPVSPIYDYEKKERFADRKPPNLHFLAEFDNDIYDNYINGLYYVENYINDNEHNAILQFINNNEWDKISCRLTQEYMHSFDIENEIVKKINKKPFDCMPFCVKNILLRLINENRLPIPKDYFFNELIVNNYPSFGGFEYHLDSNEYFDEYIVCISLLNEVVINFKQIETNEIKQILLKPKSLLILSGDSRHLWQHGITQSDIHVYDHMRIKRQQRISLTFRKCINVQKSQENIIHQTATNHKFLFEIDSLLNTIDHFID